jgi:Protein of unknown function (DUF2971)
MTSPRPEFDCVTLETPDDLKPLMAHYRRSARLQQRRLRLRNPEQLSRFLYKYRGFNGEYAEQNLRNIVVYSVLRLSAPATFNDPYEMFVHVVVEGTPEQRLDRFSRLVALQAPVESQERQPERVRILMERADAEHAKRCQMSISGIKERSGMFCFAGDPRSTLMWSHYAENHHGVCLQFERMRDFLTLGHAVRTNYREDLPVVNWIVDFQRDVDQLLLAKHPCWGYEQERRITSIDNANRYLQLRPDALTGIIFGCRTQKPQMDFIDKLLAEREALGVPAVKTYVATQHPTKYRLLIRRREG